MTEKIYCQIEINTVFAQAKEVEDRIVTEAQKFGYGEEIVFAVRLSLEEALSNAIRHGNKGDLDKRIRMRYCVDAESIEVYIADEGSGFDPEQVPDPTRKENLDRPSGRGIMLMKAYMNRVEYSERGNEVRLVKLNKAG